MTPAMNAATVGKPSSRECGADDRLREPSEEAVNQVEGEDENPSGDYQGEKYEEA